VSGDFVCVTIVLVPGTKGASKSNRIMFFENVMQIIFCNGCLGIRGYNIQFVQYKNHYVYGKFT